MTLFFYLIEAIVTRSTLRLCFQIFKFRRGSIGFVHHDTTHEQKDMTDSTPRLNFKRFENRKEIRYNSVRFDFTVRVERVSQSSVSR